MATKTLCHEYAIGYSIGGFALQFRVSEIMSRVAAPSLKQFAADVAAYESAEVQFLAAWFNEVF